MSEHETAPRSAGRPRRIRRRWVVALIVVVAVVAYVIVVLSYAAGGRVPVSDEQPVEPNAVSLHVAPVSVNGPGERITVTVGIAPGPDLLEPDSPTVAEDLDIIFAPVEGSQAIHLDKGDVVSTASTIILASGDVEFWPFDRYSAELTIAAYSTVDGVKKPLPTYVFVDGSVPGWDISAAESSDAVGSVTGPSGDQDLYGVDILAQRTGSTVLFGFLLLALLVTMPVLVLFVAISAYIGRRKVEATLMSWMGAMLFATIPLRGFLPGSPPIGSWIDFLVVLWVIVGLIAGLTIYVLAWNRWGTPVSENVVQKN